MEGTIDRLAALLPEAGEALTKRRDSLREVRLRTGSPLCLVDPMGRTLLPMALDASRMNGILSALLDFSLHTREDEMRQGFFTLRDGSRAGICGRVIMLNGRIAGMQLVSSLCVRVARQVNGCADALMPLMLAPEGIRSALVISAPGMGKTTLLRDLIRQISLAGIDVGVADERHELAACCQGVPTLDLGPCTDVMDGGPKAQTISAMIRSMAPRVIVTDEIGGSGDAEAVAEARRCGAAVIASAHAADMQTAMERPCLRKMLTGSCFDLAILLGGHPGCIQTIYVRGGRGEGSAAWRRASSWRES